MSKIESKDISFFVNHVLKGMRFEKRAAVVMDLVILSNLFGEKGKEA